MRLLPFKKASHENRSRKKVVPVKRTARFLKPMAYAMTGLLIAGSLAFSAIYMNNKFAVEHWQVKANPQLSKQIEQYLAEKESKAFWQTRASLLQRELLAGIPDIEALEIRRILPNGLQINAKARQPLALWENGESSVMLIDEQATAYRPLKRGEYQDLPILRLASNELPKAATLIQKIQAYDASRLGELSEVIVEDERWRLNFSYGEQWQFHQAGIEQDLEQVIRLLATPRWSGGHWRMDARIPQRWFIRPARQEVI